MSFVRTMTGDISPEKMGFTYSHEHIVCVPQHWVVRGEDDLLLDDPEKSCAEVLDCKKIGVDTIVDATAIDYGRQPKAVYDIAVKTGMQIIGTAGFNKGFLWDCTAPGYFKTFQQWIDESSIDELAQFEIDEITVGMQGTGIKAGQVKFGTGYNMMSPSEEKTIRAACRAHLATGAPLHAHTEAGTLGLEQIEIVKSEGVNPHNMSIGHMDRNPDTYYHCKLADTGVFISFDGIGKIKYYPESTRIKCILDLAKRGYQKQILVSGDTARKSYYYHYKYAQGLSFIKEKWVPRLIEEAEEAGINGERLVDDIFINNPRECFSFKKI